MSFRLQALTKPTRAELYRLANEDVVVNGAIGMPNGTTKWLVKVIDNKYNYWAGYLLTALNGISAPTPARFRLNYTANERLEAAKNAVREPQSNFLAGKMEHHSYWWGRSVVDV